MATLMFACNKEKVLEENLSVEKEFSLNCCSAECPKGNCSIGIASICSCFCSFWGIPRCEGSTTISTQLELSKISDIITYLGGISPRTTEIIRMIELLNQFIQILQSNSPQGYIDSNDSDYQTYLDILDELENLSTSLDPTQNSEIEAL